MPKLIIDGRKIEVAAGVKVIAAAEQAGIMIPHFCYHPALGSVGACRMCAVKFLEGPVHGLQMSCMVDACDGMVVSTTDDEAVDFRRFVIELLMTNHPHDCPVCDEGGHCLLQDETISGGHAVRRFMGKKRTYRDQYLGELIQHEMNRCIHCYRCRRFYQDFCGYRDFGALGTARNTYFGRYQDGPLENPFSGNLIDICPTGVLTDKPARFKGRRWDFQRTPSLCIHCSLGCHTVVSARYREVVRVESRYSDRINGHFICDRGRFGFAYTNHPDRPRQVRIQGGAAAYADALASAAEKLSAVASAAGSHAVACAASLRAGVETQMALQFLSRDLGWRPPSYFTDANQQRRVCAAVGKLSPQIAVSLSDVETADAVLVVCADPIREAPMLALAIRQARRAGASIAVLGTRSVSMPLDFQQWTLPAPDLDADLQALISALAPEAAAGLTDPGPKTAGDRVAFISEMLRSSRRPVVVCGTDTAGLSAITAAGDLAHQLEACGKQAGLFYLLPGANTYGAALTGAGSQPFSDLLAGIENGEISALVLAEMDPFHHCQDPERVKNALDRLDLLVVLDYLPGRLFKDISGEMPTDASGPIRIHFPTKTHFETATAFINQEGRLQQAEAVHAAGMPLMQWTGGTHPPREFHNDIPGADAGAAWRILSDLKTILRPSQPGEGSFADLWSRIRRELSIASGDGSENPDDVRIFPESATAPDLLKETADIGESAVPEDGSFFGTDELSSYSLILECAETSLRKKP